MCDDFNDFLEPCLRLRACRRDERVEGQWGNVTPWGENLHVLEFWKICQVTIVSLPVEYEKRLAVLLQLL